MIERSADSSKAWLIQTGSVRAVIGYAEACDFLNDPRLLCDFNLGGGNAESPESAPSLLSLNGQEHRRVRAIVGNLFNPRATGSIRPLARNSAHELIDRFELAAGCDFINDFAVPYVATVISCYLGFSSNETEHLSSLALDPRRLLELVEYSREAVAKRRQSPTDDILGAIAQAIEDGKLPSDMGVNLVAGLLAGHGPAINQLGIMVGVLSDTPDVWRAVGNGTVDAGPVVEEVLRFRSTNQGTSRRVAETFHYNGIDFTVGERIKLRLVAANHDQRRFADPSHFDMNANRGPHLAFGFGPHFCLGAALVRVQLQEALAALTARISCPRILPSENETVRSGLSDTHTHHEIDGLIGPTKLDIVFDRLVRQSNGLGS